MLEIDAALYSDYHDQQSKGNASGAGNWRSHIIINCTACHKPMAYYKQSSSAVCNTCQLKTIKRGNDHA